MVSSYRPIILLLLLLLVSPFSFALSCVAPPTLAEYFSSADAVFIAKVETIDDKGLQAEFTVGKIYKGTAPKLTTMQIKPMSVWFDKVFFKEGQRYLVFYKKDAALYWGACSRNIILLNKNNVKNLNKIMSLQKEAMELERALVF